MDESVAGSALSSGTGERGAVDEPLGLPSAVARPGLHGTRHSQVWFGPSERPLYGWVSLPASAARGAVALCPPMGEEGRASHRTFRRLAERLADAGLVALRFDYDGTGDSAGGQEDPDRVAAWLASVGEARRYAGGLLGQGPEAVAVVGMRLGATLAGCQAAACGPASSLVLWDPCQSGRTFLREGEALQAFADEAEVGGAELGVPDDGFRHTPGFQYDAATARAMRGIDLGKLPADAALAGRVLLLTREDRPPAEAVVVRVLAAGVDGADAVHEPAPGQEALLDLPPSENVVPERALRRITDWLVAGFGPASLAVSEPPQEHAVVLPSGAVGSPDVRERVVRVGSVGLYGVSTEPLVERADGGRRPWIVLVNVAAEHHIGPGRRWVEFARAWAALGYRSIRLDQSGVGESPTRPGQVEDLPYAPEWLDDMREVVAALRADGSPVVMVGLCSGSYSALEAALACRVEGVLAVNPRLTLYGAVPGTAVWAPQRRAARLPVRPIARLALRHRLTAGGIWRIYRQFAVWHAPFVVLLRIVRRGTLLRVVCCAHDAREFTEVAFWKPAFWALAHTRRFRFERAGALDHSMLGRAGQQLVFDRATTFVRDVHRAGSGARSGAGRGWRGSHRSRRARRLGGAA